MTTCAQPLAFEQIVDYVSGELAPADEAALEQHYFACAACADAVAQALHLARAVGDQIPPVVTAARVDALRERGARIRETVIRPGEDPEVWFDRDLDLLIHVLRGDLAGERRVDVELRPACSEGEPLLAIEAVPFDRASGEVRVACQRHYRDFGPDDLCFRVVGVRDDGRHVLGDYIVRHRWVDV